VHPSPSATGTRLRRLSALLVAALLTIGVAACGSSTTGPTNASSSQPTAAGFPATVTVAGASVRIEKKPTSIVSLSATATEMLYAIGADDQVKAVDEYSTYPKQAPRTKLSGLQPNIEALIAEKPDLVLTDADRGGLSKRLSSLHVPVLVIPAAKTLDDVYTEISALGTATGHESQATAENGHIKDQIQQIVAKAPHSSASASYYYELDPTYYSVTSTTFVGQLLKMLGLHSIADTAKGAAAAGGYPQLSAEFILKANPDYVFLADTICCKANAKTVAARPGWSAITAVKDHQVVALNDDIASRWGPRVVDLLQTVADAMSNQPAGK
jgi:iron complex transport system substrate-binding protein